MNIFQHRVIISIRYLVLLTSQKTCQKTSTKAIVPLQRVMLKLEIDVRSYGHFRTETK